MKFPTVHSASFVLQSTDGQGGKTSPQRARDLFGALFVEGSGYHR